MRSKTFIFLAVILFSLAFSGCGGTTPPNSNVSNTNAANNNTNNTLETTKAAPEQTTNNAPTLTPVYKAYCAAYVKKDEAALRKAYSADSVKDIEKQMKADGVKTFVEYLALDKITNDPCEVRNEQITGDSAVAEIRTTGYPNGIKVIFVKENGEWKLTTKSPALDSVKPAAANSNTAK